MLTETLLNSYLNRHISEVCGNGYADDDDNHCAHFVNHVLNTAFGVTCRSLVASSARHGTGANVRVHETFAACPNPRELLECPESIEALIFISATHNFVRHKDGSVTLNNVPKKHIGLFLNGVVWHYSNSQHKVITQTLGLFIHHYPHQTNALWVADLPAAASPASFSP